MKKTSWNHIILIAFLTLFTIGAMAQRPTDIIRGIGSGMQGGGGGGGDSLRHRTHQEDSITLRFYYFDSSRAMRMDSDITDFTKKYPVPSTYVTLGNTGTAARPIIFDPRPRAGFDPGFHSLDIYKWKAEDAKFYNTTRPYTELGYLIGSKSEQLLSVQHTQNIKPYWNFSLNYRLISSPGFFRNEKSNHNNYMLTSWYQSPSKRYNNYVILLQNKMQVEEGGGIVNTAYLKDPSFQRDFYTIPTNIGGEETYSPGYFSSAIYNGHKYKEFNFILRQQYDLGRKDSIVTDSTVIQLFYPRIRFEHTLKYGSYSYNYQDLAVTNGNKTNIPDSSAAYYAANYGFTLMPGYAPGAPDSLIIMDSWKEVSNDFSVYQYPDSRNLQQFIKLGAEVQLLHGSFRRFVDPPKYGSESLYNIMAHGEYRNRSKNQKWDIQAFGHLYMAGYNFGDYHAFVSLQRLISQKLGSLQVGFENVSRTAPYFYNQRSAFYFDSPKNFNKENTIHFFASAVDPKFGFQLRGDYYIITNYLYLSNYKQLNQESSLFNVLRISGSKDIRLTRHWILAAEVYLQEKAGAAPVNFPLMYTRDRLMYTGNLGFRNLSIAFGLEGRYHSPYYADNYSPVLGQYFYQNTVQINNLPDVAAFLNFRIRSFKAYIRAENLNSADFSNGFGFTNNNFAAPNYPMPGLVIRFGVFWGFVN